MSLFVTFDQDLRPKNHQLFFNYFIVKNIKQKVTLYPLPTKGGVT
jgi:hypothetical protein